MSGPYKNRGGQSKGGANRFLMNQAVPKRDSKGRSEPEMNKAFVIQNLFPRLRKCLAGGEIFSNNSLDSELSPQRRAYIALPVDNLL